MSDTHLDELLTKLRHSQAMVDDLNAAIETMKARVILLLGERTERDVVIDGKPVKAVKVVAIRKQYNAARLSTLLKKDPDLLDRVTERKVIPAEFERAVRTGEIDKIVATEIYREKPTNAYLRFFEQE